MKALGLIGQTFGRLKVLEFAGRDKYGHAMLRCACTCGKQTTARMASLRIGAARSCGCLHGNTKVASDYVGMIGMTFGSLTVLEFAGRDKHGQAMFRCCCTCGKQTIVRMTPLIRGGIRSCGCLPHHRRKPAIEAD
jgi:hypothetical protein